jgi:phage FluMu gp28-like protein
MKVTGFVPRDSQRLVFASPARFLVLDAGRRFGKSLTGLNWLLAGACEMPRENWYVSPIYGQGKMAFRTFLSAAHKGKAEGVFKNISHSEMRVEFVNGAAMTFKSADNPDNLRGEGLHRVVVDEAARVKREVWEAILRPAVSDTRGRVLFISTPKGKNWFYELYTRGQDPLQAEFKSWKFPTSDNPKVSAADILQARQSLPVDVFSQEYLAEFLENSAGVFRNIGECIGSIREEPLPGKEYFAGLDLARLTDFTVLTILDGAGRQVYWDRFNLLDWTVQKERIIPVIRRYRAKLNVDATGVGDPIYEDLRRAGLNVQGYKFTADSKKKLIETLMIGFDQKKISILDEKVQTNELEIFEYAIGSSGMVHYSAPEGYHDDAVIALALAYWLIGGPRVDPRIWSI